MKLKARSKIVLNRIRFLSNRFHDPIESGEPPQMPLHIRRDEEMLRLPKRIRNRRRTHCPFHCSAQTRADGGPEKTVRMRSLLPSLSNAQISGQPQASESATSLRSLRGNLRQTDLPHDPRTELPSECPQGRRPKETLLWMLSGVSKHG